MRALGHNFPFYMGFKGGKGIAVMAGLVAANSFWSLPESLLLIPVTLACFLIPVVITRYISVGSLAAYTVFLIEMILAGQLGWFDMEAARIYELDIILFALTALAWWRHRENIKRLTAGTENKFEEKKKEYSEIMANVGIIGAGSWGTALSVLLHDNGHSVTVWSIDESEVKMLDEKREHLLKLPGVKLPDDMVFTGDVEKAVQGKDFLVLAVPSVYT